MEACQHSRRLLSQAASAAAANADAMQFSAAELLAAQRRTSCSNTHVGDADSQTSAQPMACARTAEAAPAEARSEAMQVPNTGELPQIPESATGSADQLHAPARLAHRLPGEYPAPLYDAEALQLWLLQCCQTVRMP